MGLMQEHNPSHNIDQFTYEHILRDTAWLSDCSWIYKKCKRVEYSVNYIIIFHPIYILYPYQTMMMINVSLSHNMMMINNVLNLISILSIMINVYKSNENHQCFYSHIKQWWWSMCIYLISSWTNDDQFVYNVYILALSPKIFVIVENTKNCYYGHYPDNRDDYKKGNLRSISTISHHAMSFSSSSPSSIFYVIIITIITRYSWYIDEGNQRSDYHYTYGFDE